MNGRQQCMETEQCAAHMAAAAAAAVASEGSCCRTLERRYFSGIADLAYDMYLLPCVLPAQRPCMSPQHAYMGIALTHTHCTHAHTARIASAQLSSLFPTVRHSPVPCRPPTVHRQCPSVSWLSVGCQSERLMMGTTKPSS